MAKLIYAYIKHIDRGILDQEINFSNDFTVSYSSNGFEKRLLKIMKKNIKNDTLYNDKIENNILLLGKNGTGKTSVLDLIGLNEKSKKEIFGRLKYFIIYHVKDNLFYFSGTIVSEIKNLNVEKILSNKFYFLKTNDNNFEIIDQKPNEKKFDLDIFYIKNSMKYSWSSPKKIYRGKEEGPLNYYSVNSNFDDVLMFYLQSDFFHGENRSIEIHQKYTYPNNPKYLYSLYNFNSEDIDINSKEFLFLKENNVDYLNEKYKFFSRKNISNIQEKRIEDKQIYFAFRLLEKLILSALTESSNESYDLNYRFKIVEFIFSKNIKDIFYLENFSDDYLENRIERLHSLVEQLIIKKYIKLDLKKFNYLMDLILLKSEIPNDFFGNNVIKSNSYNSRYASELSTLFTNFKSILSPKLTQLSDGESVYLNTYSKIYRAIMNSKSNDVMLLLDEPDSNFHPEWSRLFINELYKLIQVSKKEGKVQIVISSHSPFIATDFPKENIFSFNKNQKKLIEISNPKFGFAGSIYDILSDTMFLDAPIGEFALKKIQSIKKNKSVSDSKFIVNQIDDKILKNAIIEEMDK